MNIMFECNDGSYVVEVLPSRLYAKVNLDKDIIAYDDSYNLLLNPASFHEYRGEDKMLYNKIDKLIREDLEKSHE